MPCRCDDYYDREVIPREPTLQEKLNNEHEKRCHAQSLVNKLACILEKNNIKLDYKIEKNVAATREDLLKHKREEAGKDLEQLRTKLHQLDGNMKQIENLGGIVPPVMLANRKDLQAQINAASAMTDAQILGNETT